MKHLISEISACFQNMLQKHEVTYPRQQAVSSTRNMELVIIIRTNVCKLWAFVRVPRFLIKLAHIPFES